MTKLTEFYTDCLDLTSLSSVNCTCCTHCCSSDVDRNCILQPRQARNKIPIDTALDYEFVFGRVYNSKNEKPPSIETARHYYNSKSKKSKGKSKKGKKGKTRSKSKSKSKSKGKGKSKSKKNNDYKKGTIKHPTIPLPSSSPSHLPSHSPLHSTSHSPSHSPDKNPRTNNPTPCTELDCQRPTNPTSDDSSEIQQPTLPISGVANSNNNLPPTSSTTDFKSCSGLDDCKRPTNPTSKVNSPILSPSNNNNRGNIAGAASNVNSNYNPGVTPPQQTPPSPSSFGTISDYASSDCDDFDNCNRPTNPTSTGIRTKIGPSPPTILSNRQNSGYYSSRHPTRNWYTFVALLGFLSWLLFFS